MRADRWQTGDCGVYAVALIRSYPQLRLGTIINQGTAPGHALHFFAHDEHRAYDSRGQHPLPYLSVWDSAAGDYFSPESAARLGFRCVLNASLESFGPLNHAETAKLPAAHQHIRRHGIHP